MCRYYCLETPLHPPTAPPISQFPPPQGRIVRVGDIINPGFCITRSQYVSSFDIGSHTSYAILGCLHDGDASDNVKSVSFDVAADVAVTNLTVERQGSQLVATAQICNEGPVEVTVSAGLYVDRDPADPDNRVAPDIDSGLITLKPKWARPVGSCQTLSGAYDLGEDDVAVVWAMADYAQTISEENEDNNILQQGYFNCDSLNTAGLDPDEFVVEKVICLYNQHKHDDYVAEIDAFLATQSNVVIAHHYEDNNTTLVMDPMDPDNEAFFEVSLTLNDRAFFFGELDSRHQP